MPWTRKQVRYLESSGSPLTSAQKAKMNRELHDNPALGHMKKGSKEMEKAAPLHHMEIHPAENGGHMVEHHFKMSKGSKSGALMSMPEPEKHVFGPEEGHKMLAHVGQHLGISKAEESADEEGESE